MLRSLAHKRPAWVRVHQKSGELYVFSWRVATTRFDLKDAVPPSITRYSALPEAKKLDTVGLPDRNAGQASYRYGTTFYQYFAALDSWAEEPTVWLVQDWAMENVLTRDKQPESAIELYRIKDGKLNLIRSFEKELASASVPVKVHRLHRQRLFANPQTGELYLAEGDTFPVQAFRYGSGYALQFHPDVTHATICRWTTRGHERTFLPNAKPRAAHFTDRAVYDPAGRAWLAAFLNHWLGLHSA